VLGRGAQANGTSDLQTGDFLLRVVVISLRTRSSVRSLGLDERVEVVVQLEAGLVGYPGRGGCRAVAGRGRQRGSRGGGSEGPLRRGLVRCLLGRMSHEVGRLWSVLDADGVGAGPVGEVVGGLE